MKYRYTVVSEARDSLKVVSPYFIHYAGCDGAEAVKLANHLSDQGWVRKVTIAVEAVH
jgi:hypothetical protein